MNSIRQFIGRLRLQWRGKNHIVGWSMTPEEAVTFLRGQRKTVLTFVGYSVEYQDRIRMLNIVRNVLWQYSPRLTLVNIGATAGGLGGAYQLIKNLGFETSGVVSSEALAYPDSISEAVDHVCFINDTQWGGKLPDSNQLSPTSEAMVACSDVFVAIGGGDISRDELLEAKARGKPIQYFPAEMDHDTAIQRAESSGSSFSDSSMGSVHEIFGK